MDFYYRSLPEGRCEVVCTRCFLTLGAAREMEGIRRMEDSHRCPAAQPTASVHARSADPWAGVAPTLRRPSAPAAHVSMRRMVQNALLLLAAAFALYLLPTVFEFAALRHWNPWISTVLPGDLAGCAFLCIVLRKVKAGICLYCLLTLIEACVYRLHIMPLSVLPWFTDLVPTIVVSMIVLRSARDMEKIVTIS
jgi:hypothetical protein